jgi:hypothetical protein
VSAGTWEDSSGLAGFLTSLGQYTAPCSYGIFHGDETWLHGFGEAEFLHNLMISYNLTRSSIGVREKKSQ